MPDSSKKSYQPLAKIYDDAGFSGYTGALTPRILTHLQQTGWIGRRVIDLGCGTGVASAFFGSTSMVVTGIDISPEMLEIANLRIADRGYSVDFREGDIRGADYPQDVDLVFCFGNVLNEMRSLREIEAVFARAFGALAPGKKFVFDFTTLKGLLEQIGTEKHILDISDRLFITVETDIIYESMAVRQRLIAFMRDKDSNWERSNANLMLRGYPHTAVMRLLEKQGFQNILTYNTNLAEIDPTREDDGQLIIIADRPE